MNYFIVNQKDRMIWADVPYPKTVFSVLYGAKRPTEKEIEDWHSRPHYPYSTELNWIDGQRVEWEVDFEIRERMNSQLQVFRIAVPLPSKDKEEKTERGDWRKELAGYLGYTSFEQLDTAERSIAEWMEKHFKK